MPGIPVLPRTYVDPISITTITPEGYSFPHGDLPDEVAYAGNISATAIGNNFHVLAADRSERKWGKIALSAIGSAFGFINSKLNNVPLTADANTASFGYPTGGFYGTASIQFSVRTEGTSAVVMFVKMPGGSTLSGFVNLGPVI